MSEYLHTGQTQGALTGLSTWVQTASPSGYLSPAPVIETVT